MLLILQNLFLHAIFAAIPAVGFAMLFNVPKSALKYCAMGGAIVYTCREFFMNIFSFCYYWNYCTILV